MNASRKLTRAGGVVATLVLAGTLACGGESRDGAGTGAGPGGRGAGPGEPVGTTTASSPFTVGHEPDGHRLVQAGRGTMSQTWSSDSFGDDEPVTVLAPRDADPDGPEAVRVSLTGFEGFQGGLEQASAGYMDDRSESFEIDGRRAIYTPAGGDEDDRSPGATDGGAGPVDGGSDDAGSTGTPADLVVVAGDDLAIRVQAAEANRDELVEVARQVEPGDDHLLAPAVPEPPGDLEVVGWADADVAVTLLTAPTPASESLPAGERAHTAVWARGAPGSAWTAEGGTVAVSTLPGQALDLDAVAASLHRYEFLGERQVTARPVDGRPGVVFELSGNADAGVHGGLRAVVTSTPGGELLLVVAHGAELVDADELVAVAASVEPAGPEEWDETVLRARGGPGLRPDDGAVELARGTAGDVEWLLQSRVDDGTVDDGLSSSEDPDTTGQHVVDPCLKLAGGERACATGTSESHDPSGSIVTVNTADPTELDAGGDFPGFVLLTTDLPAATMRVHTGDGPVDVPLVTLPGGTRRSAVLVTESDLGLHADCRPGTDPGALTLLDPTNNPLPC